MMYVYISHLIIPSHLMLFTGVVSQQQQLLSEDTIPTCKSLDAYNFTSIPDYHCYTKGGQGYRGLQNVSIKGKPCLNWKNRELESHGVVDGGTKYGIGDHAYCRNPIPSDFEGPWCFIDNNVTDRCNLLRCGKYVDVHDPLLDVPTITCDRGRSEHIFPDIMYQFRGILHYVTRKRLTYVVYNFTSSGGKSIGVPPIQTSAQAWNYCPQPNDTATFVTSFDDEHLFIYFEKPNAMIKITFEPYIRWEKIDADVYSNCTDKAMPFFNETFFTSLRQVYSALEPQVVFLLSNDYFIRCEWNRGTLHFINSTKSIFGQCPYGKIHFIDEYKRYFQLDDTIGNRDNGLRQDVIRSLEEAVYYMPTLALAFGGYEILNRKSLVRLDGDDCTGRIFRLYEWSNFDSVMKLMIRGGVEQAWVQVHNINTKKALYCQGDAKNGSCCSDFVRDFLQTNNIARNEVSCDPDTLFTPCLLSFVKKEGVKPKFCPTVLCKNDDITARIFDRGETIACEIALEDDPPCFAFINQWESYHKVVYQNAAEAISALDQVVAKISLGLKFDSDSLDMLTQSVKALEYINYTAISKYNAENLISNLLVVADAIVDMKFADAWMPISRDQSVKSSSGKAKSSPLQMLLIMDRILTGIMSSWLAGSNEPNFYMEARNDNVISIVTNMATYSGDKDMLVEFHNFTGLEDSFIVLSKYPSVLNMVSYLEELSEDETSQYGKSPPNEMIQYMRHSHVLSVSIISRMEKGPISVEFALPYNDEDINSTKQPRSKHYFSCRYLTYDKDNDMETWRTDGCRVIKVDRANKLVWCSCNHTTNFAILLQPIPRQIKKQDMRTLCTLSYIGESISCICLFLTLGIFTKVRHYLKSARMTAHFNLVVSLIIFHTTQLFSIFAEESKNSNAVPCIIVAFLTHFSLLAAFGWMLMEGLLLYVSVVNVFSNEKDMKKYQYLVGWGFPCVISCSALIYGLTRSTYPTCYLEGVGEWSCINQDESMNPDSEPSKQLIEWCWLSSKNGLVWTQTLPSILVVMVNFIILSRVWIVIAKSVKSANMYRPTTEQRKDKHVRKCVKGALILMPILGLPWMLGFIPGAATQSVFLYLFVIVNSTQGLFIFLFHCVRNKEVRSAVGSHLTSNRFRNPQTSTKIGSKNTHSKNDELPAMSVSD